MLKLTNANRIFKQDDEDPWPWYKPPRRRVSFDESNIASTSKKAASEPSIFGSNSTLSREEYEASLRHTLRLPRAREIQEVREMSQPLRRVHFDEANILATSSRKKDKRKIRRRKVSHRNDSDTSTETAEDDLLETYLLRDKLKARRLLFEATKKLLDQNLQLQDMLEKYIEAICRPGTEKQDKPSRKLSYKDALHMQLVLQEGQEVMQDYLVSRRGGGQVSSQRGRFEIQCLHQQVLEMLGDHQQ